MKRILTILLICALAVSMTACANSTDNSGSLSFSWWGGDTRHEVTQKAVSVFMEKNPDIKVNNEYSAWSGWEDKMGQRFASKSAPDVNQINWNWITAFSADGSKFVDLKTLSDVIDLTQFEQAGLDACTVAGKLQALPISMTGRIFYWNKTTFEKAGIDVPTSYAELISAGQTFKEKLGEDFYPLALGTYDRMILMVYYLESVYGKNWVENNQLMYSKEEVAEGLNFIMELENAHVTPSMQKLTGDGADSLDKNTNWTNGHYAGIFEWDSSASKFEKALEEGQELVVGDFFKDFGAYQGGFAKVSMCFAISETAKDKTAAGKLVNFLLNSPEGAKIMGSERGIPLSKTAKEICEEMDLLDPKVLEANTKVLDWVKFSLDPLFESNELKATESGLYAQAMNNLSYGTMTAVEAADMLVEGIEKVLAAAK